MKVNLENALVLENFRHRLSLINIFIEPIKQGTFLDPFSNLSYDPLLICDVDGSKNDSINTILGNLYE